ncbi:ABC transporter [Rhizocola hellebori]|uniref:ABC transporter n=1 Tax=Rhizocola hellebori TaxID=1392758 RepID=A0A8J3VFR2_9ACTN|nr:ABC transporter ATP-binding protein [Rhizocola hellebori]GIH04362.1 ABC transporter [Rhizocola hellebori]
MRPLPVADPGTPEVRSATRYLWWLAGHQLGNLAYGMFFGIAWMLSGALMPYVLGRGVDAGVVHRDLTSLAQWAGVFILLAATQTTCGLLRHRNAVFNFLSASFRTVQSAIAHAGKLGATLPKRLATGEVVAIGASDTNHIGNALDITARFAGAIVTVIVVSVILLNASVTLGLVVVLGVPVAIAITSLLVKPLHHRQVAYRHQQGALTGRAVDIVSGLRVLRGIGGESVFSSRFRTESQKLRDTGVSVGRVDSLLEASKITVPALLMILVTWLGARQVIAGEISVGQLVSFYGYATFMVVPLRTFGEALDKFIRGHVAATRVLKLLQLQPEIADPATPVQLPVSGPLADVKSGLTLQPGIFMALVSDRPDDAIDIADRLGRYTDGEVTLAGVPLSSATREQVRQRILVSDNNSRLFSGALREELDPTGRCDDEELRRAITAASAEDIVEALPEGLDAFVAERGREFSGGQQQRLRLVRALMTDVPILILVEPTSAVDAHTEARIAARLGAYRQGRTTLITSTSPLVLDRAERVAFVEDGKVIAEGTHRELMANEPRYHAVVTRGED